MAVTHAHTAAKSHGWAAGGHVQFDKREAETPQTKLCCCTLGSTSLVVLAKKNASSSSRRFFTIID